MSPSEELAVALDRAARLLPAHNLSGKAVLVLEASALNELDPALPSLVRGPWEPGAATEAKRLLLSLYPRTHQVVLLDSPPSAEGQASRATSLHDVAPANDLRGDAMLFVPALSRADAATLPSLRSLVARLREPGGCPWDREQTHESLKPHVVEEAYEAAEAIERHDYESLRDELGDLLLQVVMHAQLAAEEGHFGLGDVIATLRDKLIRRHPHVFGNVVAKDAREVLANWEELKRDERGDGKSLLEGLPSSLPSLIMADKIQRRVRQVGFDWPNLEGVVLKVREELEELTSAQDVGALEREMGDLLFSLANLSRHLGINPEDALRKTNRRFTQRFQRLEEMCGARGVSPADLSLEELDSLWDQAKAAESG